MAAAVRWQAFRCEPFGHLPAAADRKERHSRSQAGDAIRLLRALRTVDGEEEARRITRRVIRASALAFLESSVGDMSPASFANLSKEQREESVRARLDRFPNVTTSLLEASEDQVRFDVSRCRLLELTHEAGEPSLAHVFCSSDAAFFAAKGLRLDRPSTLANGDDACTFQIRHHGPS
ncbi:MAG: L-2-amino-thiazoline-4-carboxylic acid hydrolase [Myxococcota bacterium]